MKIHFPIKYAVIETTLEELLKFHNIETIRKYCTNCPKHNTIWSCPEFSFKEEDYLKNFNYAYIISAKVFTNDIINDLLINKSKGTLDSKNLLKIKETDNINSDIINAIYNNLRFVTDDKMFKLEETIEGSTSLIGGRCMLCTNCSRLTNSPCIYPNKLRYSLEALGFDVGKTSKHFLNEEILWNQNNLPEFTLSISALLTEDKIDSELILRTFQKESPPLI